MNIAVVGIGVMGRRHLEIIRNLGLRLVGICDARPEALREAQDKFQLPAAVLYTDARRMLAETKPEALIVSTTASSHCLYTCLGAEHGARYILCEKPMGISIEECDRMIETCAAHGVKLAINHPIRYMEQYREAKRIVQSPEFGGLSSIAVITGNCGVSMNGVHYFEMFRYMNGEPPVEVTAWLSGQETANPRGAQYEDHAGSVRLTTASGKRLYVEMGADQGHGVKMIYSGRCGQLLVDELAQTMSLTVRHEQYRNMPTIRNGLPHADSVQKISLTGTLESTQRVLQALLNDDRPPSGAEGRLAVLVLVAAHVSHERRRTVQLTDPDLPRTRTFRWA